MIFNKTWGPPFEPGTFAGSMRKPSHADYQAQCISIDNIMPSFSLYKPFFFQPAFSNIEYDIFERNEYYWGQKPKYKYVKVLVLPDANSRIIALETGKIDMLIGEGSFTIENFVRLSKNKNIAAYKSEPRVTNMIAINTAKNNTKDVNVRKAVMMAVNKDNIIKYILLNQEIKAEQIFILKVLV